MAYLTYDEFKELNKADVDEKTFDKLLPKASALLNNVTNHFYVTNDILLDNPWRVNQFKQALCAQIDYFNDVGTSSHEINNPLTVSMGRTQVMTGADNQKKTNKVVSDDVYMLLSLTGLLYRGLK